MLGYILSKMQMLIFATGILLVGILFLGFISNLELKTVADNILLTNTSAIISVLSAKEGLDYKKSISIPDRLVYGLNGSSQLFYDLNFSWVVEGNKNALILSVNEHGKNTIISAQKVLTDDTIILVDPGFIAENSISPNFGTLYYNKQQISLYPRAANKGTQTTAPNSFSILREAKAVGDKLTWNLYIIPCTTLRKDTPVDNCTKNIFLIGCYKLSLRCPPNDTSVDSVFDVTRDLGADSQTQYRGMTWGQCKDIFPSLTCGGP